MSKTTPAKPSRDFTFSASDLAAIIGVSDRTLTRWARQGMPRVGRGRYDLRACLAWHVERTRAAPEPGAPSARDLLARAQREKVMLETQFTRAGLLPETLVAEALAKVQALIGDEVDRLATPELAALIATIDDPARLQSALFARTRETRSAIAARLRTLGGEIAQT